MTVIVPDYYNEFRCIADKCTHSCCIGWEICIDDFSMNYYNSVEGEIGEEIRGCISYDGEPHFELTEGERCPLLMSNGLCRLICELGEESLCDICREHPRFHNFYDSFEEVGLGLCCEEAARLILTRKGQFSLVITEGGNPFLTPEEERILSIRKKAIDILCERSEHIDIRMNKLKALYSGKLPYTKTGAWARYYLELERLDDKWTHCLELLKDSDRVFDDFGDFDGEMSTALEQLAVYFLYRHIPTALQDGDVYSKIGFAYVSCSLIAQLWRESSRTLHDFISLSMMYSAEIEYSDCNPEEIFDLLKNP